MFPFTHEVSIRKGTFSENTSAGKDYMLLSALIQQHKSCHSECVSKAMLVPTHLQCRGLGKGIQ